MKGAVLTATILAAQSVLPAGSQEAKPWDVTQLCGQIEYVRRVSDRKSTGNFIDKRKPITDLVVDLYELADGRKLIDSSKTDKRGLFHLGNHIPGRYWLSMNWNRCKNCGVEAVLNVGKGDISCSGQGIGIDDSGTANWWTTVAVD